jgi:hypothetical protein
MLAVCRAHDPEYCVVCYCRAFCVGGKDTNTRVYGARHFSNLMIYSLHSHKDVVVGAFFEHDSLDVRPINHNLLELCNLKLLNSALSAWQGYALLPLHTC